MIRSASVLTTVVLVVALLLPALPVRSDDTMKPMDGMAMPHTKKPTPKKPMLKKGAAKKPTTDKAMEMK